jgi:hypothetical protein
MDSGKSHTGWSFSAFAGNASAKPPQKRENATRFGGVFFSDCLKSELNSFFREPVCQVEVFFDLSALVTVF